MDASDARGRGVDIGGRAAAFWSPERRRRRVDAAEGRAHGGDDSGTSAASRQVIFGEEVEATTAHLVVAPI